MGESTLKTSAPGGGGARSQRDRNAVIIEKGESSYGAYVPELPGCVAVGETEKEALRLISGAIEMHLQSMIDDVGRDGQPGHT